MLGIKSDYQDIVLQYWQFWGFFHCKNILS